MRTETRKEAAIILLLFPCSNKFNTSFSRLLKSGKSIMDIDLYQH
ncbi:MAG: hypothetical protein ANABAC_1109 [Anaerolineae bacterium]|nr:MAG: hypothetical protein ANABAC_1109 [Anaerolineae bacterium]